MRKQRKQRKQIFCVALFMRVSEQVKRKQERKQTINSVNRFGNRVLARIPDIHRL